MGFKLSRRSLSRLNGVHPDIVAVIRLAIQNTPIDFAVIEGLRSLDRQKQLVASGASQTMNSRHLTGHAVDIAPFVDGQISWHWPHYHQLAPAIKEAAQELGVSLEWGGDWRSFKDGPHWQLSWDEYGKTDMAPRAKGAKAIGHVPNAVVQIDTPAPPPKPVELPEGVAAILEDADKAPSSSSTIMAQVKQWLGSMGLSGAGLLAFFRDQDSAVQMAILAIVAAIAIYLVVSGGSHVVKERTRKQKEARATKEALGL
ncbi:M15 family metallopeptidase [Shimia ponticola]|uniref:M15 family metallopeptidase n=1 Tax=Shimia ponticola TaxID=2582893 RepID=UPI0011BEED8B|nr:M15 family metallopeptidase [Shimia ponticola]